MSAQIQMSLFSTLHSCTWSSYFYLPYWIQTPIQFLFLSLSLSSSTNFPYPPGTTLGMASASRTPYCSAYCLVSTVLGIRGLGPVPGGLWARHLASLSYLWAHFASVSCLSLRGSWSHHRRACGVRGIFGKTVYHGALNCILSKWIYFALHINCINTAFKNRNYTVSISFQNMQLFQVYFLFSCFW